uniref:EGF-like domain-containing protein n=1 Tax=Pseudictyota dubia TaxID=2749911 RepID=A0A7R9W665_9STRA|mmetsp:Transcript_34497/g.63755  ORF Transcript_34497/g.63755 Transcript_34497/m.63755 type:complete len:1619 (+) Transcript_34497:77-4933(+)
MGPPPHRRAAPLLLFSPLVLVSFSMISPMLATLAFASAAIPPMSPPFLFPSPLILTASVFLLVPSVAQLEEGRPSDEATTVTSCPILCRNGGTCVESESVDPQSGGTIYESFCECPERYHGETCEFATDTCPDETLSCRNGSRCSLRNAMDASEGFWCDCQAAGFGTGTAAGRECEHAAEARCGYTLFCTNGGKCPDPQVRSGFPDDSRCDCPAGREGRMCEYEAGTAPECTLECRSGGVCAFGAVPRGDPYAKSPNPYVGQHTGGMHCVCPPRYVGVLCDEKEEEEDPSGGAEVGGPEDEREWEGCCDNNCRNGGACVAEGGPRHPVTGDPILAPECGELPGDDGAGVPTEASTTKFLCICPPGFEGYFCERKSEGDVGAGNGDDNRECTLDCSNGGTCAFGPGTPDPFALNIRAPFATDQYEVGVARDMHCKCPDGYTGLTCNVQVSEECLMNEGEEFEQLIIDGTDRDTGFLHSPRCFHGGTCPEGGTWGSCDCSPINAPGRINFVGRYCEYEISWFCSAEDGGPGLFCANGGRCPRDELQDSCVCPSGFEGVHCELRVEEEPEDVRDCTLLCNHGGTCAFGSKSRDGFAWTIGHPLLTEEPTSVYGMHCRCPDGYTGVTCDFVYETCAVNGGDDLDAVLSDGGRYQPRCFHGGTCPEGGVWGTCDCTDATVAPDGDVGVNYVGRYCEYRVDSSCSKEDPEDVDAGADADAVATRFCANGGKCPWDTTQIGCDCEPGFTGEHCELREKNTDGDDNGDTNQNCGIGLVCENGSKCIRGSSRRCDCTTADGLIYAGLRCEYEATMFCFAVGDSDADAFTVAPRSRVHDNNGDGGGGRRAQAPQPIIPSFCVNHGKCRAMVKSAYDPHPGCDCPDGYYGDRCQLVMEDVAGEGTSTTRSPYDNADCTLSCANGGTCEFGVGAPDVFGRAIGAPFALKVHSIEGMYCRCPEGFTGIFCDVPFEACAVNGGDDLDAVLADGLYDYRPKCFHGGSCPEGGTWGACDCTDATAAVPGAEDVIYVGRYCEYQTRELSCAVGGEVVSTIHCANRGRCPWDETKLGCDCPTGFSGTHCELRESKVDEKGEGEVCGINGSLRCQHGSKCYIGGREGGPGRCDCSTADPPHYSGFECENELTDLCVDADAPAFAAAQSRNGAGGGDGGGRRAQAPPVSMESMTPFCVNYGECRSRVGEGEPHPGCDCPAAYYGDRCQYLVDGYDGKGGENGHGGDGDCTLRCANGGTCFFGSRTIYPAEYDTGAPFATEEHVGGMHCRCPDGFTGVLCDVRFEQCSMNGWGEDLVLAELNGRQYRPQCFHGGVCPQFGNVPGACDCSEVRGPVAGAVYVGKFCEYEVTSTCAEGSENATIKFCANKGVCPKNETQSGCGCPPGFGGVHCELREVNANNGGETPDLGEACGNNGRRCRNGSKCVRDRGGEEGGSGRCDCSTANPPIYAGMECEHEASQFCIAATTTARSHADNVFGGGRRAQAPPTAVQSMQPFCVNRGMCRSIVAEGETHPGCDCPSSYYGDRCQYLVGMEDSSGDGVRPLQSDPTSAPVIAPTGNSSTGERAGAPYPTASVPSSPPSPTHSPHDVFEDFDTFSGGSALQTSAFAALALSCLLCWQF